MATSEESESESSDESDGLAGGLVFSNAGSAAGGDEPRAASPRADGGGGGGRSKQKARGGKRKAEKKRGKSRGEPRPRKRARAVEVIDVEEWQPPRETGSERRSTRISQRKHVDYLWALESDEEDPADEEQAEEEQARLWAEEGAPSGSAAQQHQEDGTGAPAHRAPSRAPRPEEAQKEVIDLTSDEECGDGGGSGGTSAGEGDEADDFGLEPPFRPAEDAEEGEAEPEDMPEDEEDDDDLLDLIG